MASYTRQSSFSDGDTISSSLFNNEYNQLVTAFSYSSSGTTGHRHDGTAGEGGNIPTVGDQDFLNKITVDSTNNRWGVFVQVSGSAVEQIRIQDGGIVPVTDSDVDLGTSSLYFKAAYIDAITTTGDVAVGGNLTVTGTTTFNGGTITMGDAATDNVVFGANVDSHIIPDDDGTYDLGSSTQEWKDIYIDGTAYVDAINFNGTAITSTAAELNILDGVTSTAAELNILDGVTATATELNLLDGVTATTAELNILDGVTSTAAELNILDGVTATATELNLIDGVTATTAELNILDGVTATATEINLLDGVTSTTAELNILDGVTSTAAELNILDGKAFLDEDDMASDSATGIASQQSIKAYVDAQQDTVDTFAEVLALSNTTGGTDIAVSTGDDITFADSSKAIFGAGSDLQIYHDGSNSIITDGGTGSLLVRGSNVWIQNADGSETGARFITDGAIDLRYDNAIKLATTSTGIDVTGTVTATELSIAEFSTSTNVFESNVSGDKGARLRAAVSDAATPTFSFHDDTNTGMYSSGADTLNFSTAGTERLRIDSSGNVGIGTSVISNPNSYGSVLNIEGYAPALVLSEDTGRDYTIGVNGNKLSIFDETTPVMTIDDSGNVGIGTSSPDTLLELSASNDGAASNNTLRFTDTDNATQANQQIGKIEFKSNDASGDGALVRAFINCISEDTTPSSAITFATNPGGVGNAASEAMRIDSSGRVGIGASPSSHSLEVWRSGGDHLLLGRSGVGTYELGISSDNALTFEDAGSERLRIDSSGNVGIGTSSPNVSLEVDGGTANGSIARFHNNGDRYLELSAESDGTYDDAISVFKKNSSVGQFAFRNPTTEYMRIDSSGRVGIGTASPSYPLTIHNTGDGIKFEVSDTVDANYRIQVSGSNIVTGPSTSSAYIFQTGNTERARIDSSGNVGIGTTSPSYKMSLRDDSTSSYPLSLENNNIGTAGVHTGIRFGYVGNTYQKGAIIFESQDGSGRGKMYFALEGTANSSNADETDAKMTIDYDGNVGIGTSSPDAPLTVNAGSDNLVGMFESSDTLSYISFKDSGTTSDTSVALGASGDNFTVYTGSSFGSERMRIDSSGNLLVGSTSDSGTDYHYLKSDGFVRHKRAGGIVGVFDRGTSDGDIVNFRKDGTTVGSIGVENGVDLTVGNADTGLRFVAGDNAIWPFNMSTGTDRDNAVSLGVSGARFKDAYLSGGIYLGGTAAANKLYDYEEGTFTPFFAHGNSPVDVGSSYAYQTGVYRKVGNVVYYIIDMDATISTTATGYVSVHGLPFTSANSNVSRFPVATDRDCHSLTVPSGSILSVWVNANTTHLYIQSKSLTSNNSSNMTSWDSSGRFNVSGFYFTS